MKKTIIILSILLMLTPCVAFADEEILTFTESEFADAALEYATEQGWMEDAVNQYKAEQERNEEYYEEAESYYRAEAAKDAAPVVLFIIAVLIFVIYKVCGHYYKKGYEEGYTCAQGRYNK